MKLTHVFLLALFTQSAFADSTPTTQPDKKVIGYLGLGVDVVSPQLRAVLPKNIPADQGIVVTSFSKISPAAEEGLKVHDVLLAYDNKPISDPAAFIQWIRDDQPKTDVVLKVVRQGKEKTLNIEIGSQPAVVESVKAQASRPMMPSMGQQQRMTGYPVPGYTVQPPVGYPPVQMYPPATQQIMPMAPQSTPAVAPPGKDYEGLAIRKIGQDIYEASIGFVDSSGQKQRRAYKGNRQQLYAQVLNAKDLPQATRQQLLFAIGPRQQQQNNNFFGMPMNGFTPNKWLNGWR
ncbi:MAG: Unknown protein [uncultured Thiotrichaceae bacterium]|uniref:PDZ domain-containing protein n=1 Tax=uncultured Thiotrichaceae bacterium TaxID=298394 RepID=A0A6S6U1R5_9GAMM|nr:MAG: Unknown protein [uncultured Thiotrichaceae bacterium]